MCTLYKYEMLVKCSSKFLLLSVSTYHSLSASGDVIALNINAIKI